MGPDPHHDTGQVWRVCVDTGGTFTDCLAVDPAGAVHRAKVLSSGAVRAVVAGLESPSVVVLAGPWADRPGFALGALVSHGEGRARVAAVEPLDGRRVRFALDQALPGLAVGSTAEVSTGEEAPILAARMVTGTPASSPLPPTRLRLATTRGTNALLERRGAPTAFFVTEGFADLLVIGDQTRPELFTLRVRRPPPLHGPVVEVRERLDASGGIVTPLDLAGLRERAGAVLGSGVRVAAVALMHAWRQPRHERQVRDELLRMGFEHVSASSDLGSTIGFLARAETAVVNAYLAPVIDRYLDRVRAPLGAGSSLLVMTSAGSLIDRAGFAPKDSLLSGPAGGVVGAAEAGRRAGFSRVVTFDMGGTSTDCARCEGAPERVYQTRVGDARIVAPCVAVETVAAGGGSVCSADRGELRVGPQSAGADPGPACYGRGGPLTITDCNLLLGRLDPAHFAVPLDRAAAEARAQDALAHARTPHAPAHRSPPREHPGIALESLLSGFLAIADQRMAEAVRRITIRRGHDPAEHALVAFGGAGPQHACAIADALGLARIVVPPDAGLLSAFGLSVSSLERVADEQVLMPLDAALPALADRFAPLEARALGALPRGGGGASFSRTVELRYLGQDDILELDAEEAQTLAPRFERRYHDIFGYSPAGRPLELVAVRVTARQHGGSVSRGSGAGVRDPEAARPREGPGRCRVFTTTWQDCPVFSRGALPAGGPLPGPALITEAHSTTYLAPGWLASADASGSMVLARVAGRASGPHGGESGRTPQARAASRAAPRSEAVEVELAAGKLTAIAEEMGERLRRTAISTNVKQRRDFSCAILDAEGRLVVNAPHVPVHLGSMGVCVRAVRGALGPDLRHAVVLTNHPAFGGSHLPDLTVIEPIHDSRGALLGYTAARAHHAEIGGIAPASMAPEAARLDQEGVVIPPTPLGPPDRIDWALTRGLFTRGPYPSRDPETNCRDLAAAIHAVSAGADGLRQLAAALGPARFDAIGAAIRRRAESRLRAALARVPDGTYRHTEPVLDGGPVAVAITVHGETATIDFAGSGPVHPRCLNATPAIVTSAVIYVLRLLIDEDLPLNEGLLGPIELRVPEGMLHPQFVGDPGGCPAVAGGNVEISQLLVEAMLSAMGMCGQSQGTMNNLVLGNESFGFYETLAGGCGATPGFPGASACHSHMTNTAITDAEILELRSPVRLDRVAVRRGSGGAGAWPGGDGIERRYRLLAAASVGLLRGRARPPRGENGAEPGDLGRNRVISTTRSARALGPRMLTAPPGSVVCIETPGGGGFGETTETGPSANERCGSSHKN